MKKGILVISHGSRDVSWVDQVEMLIQEAKLELEKRGHEQANGEGSLNIPICTSYLELVEGRLIQDGINYLQNEGVTHIYVLPLFVSAGSSHVEEIKQAFGFSPISDFIGDLEPFHVQAKVTFQEPIVDDAEVVRILHEQIAALSQQQQQEAVLLIGHGSSMSFFYERWEQGMKSLAYKLSQAGQLPEIYYASLLPENAKEKLEQLLELPRITDVIVIPVFISPGYFTTKVIPKALAGLDYVYQGKTLLPHQEMVNLLLSRMLSVCDV